MAIERHQVVEIPPHTDYDQTSKKHIEATIQLDACRDNPRSLNMSTPVSNYLNLGGGDAGIADDDAGVSTATEAGSFSEGTSLALFAPAIVSIGADTSSSFPE